MKAVLRWLKEHATAIGVLVSVIALLGSGVGVLLDRMSAGALPDLLVSSPTTFRPLGGFEVRQREGATPPGCEATYGAGLEVEFTLSHDKQAELPITVHSIEVLSEYEAGARDGLELVASADAQHGKGTEDPYAFTAWLNGDSVEIEAWRWKDDSTVVPRGRDLLASDNPRRPVLRNNETDDTETIVGTLEATEPGLYRVWLRIRGATGDRTVERETDHACIYFAR